MPQSGLTSRDRRVRRSRTVGAKTIVSLISFLACLYESSLPPRSESRGGNCRRIEPLRETRGREGGEGKKGVDHKERASRSSWNVVRFTWIGDSKNGRGSVSGSRVRRDAPRASSVITIAPSTRASPRYASGMRLLGAGLVAEKTSTAAATGPRRKYGC